MSDGEGLAWGGGGNEGWDWGGGVKVQKYTSAIQYRSGEIFTEPRIFLFVTIADSLLLGQTEFL